jgi:hypothetical protein
MILEGFGFVAFFVCVKGISFCICLSEETFLNEREKESMQGTRQTKEMTSRG